MADDAAFPHFCNALADQRVLICVQLDVVGNRFVNKIAARTILRSSQRIECIDLFGHGAEADSFLGRAHNAKTITCIISYYNVPPVTALWVI